MRPGDPDGINLPGAGTSPMRSGWPGGQAAQPNGAGDRNAITL